MRISKEARQEIVREFAIRHNGSFNPQLFLEEVRRRGEAHPAYGWFEWDTKKAALAHQVEQARDFARDLRVTFTVEEVGRSGTVRIKTATMPMVLSPMATRQKGGGYLLVDPEEPGAYLAEHCGQAAVALRQWLSRYRSALDAAGLPAGGVEELASQLEGAAQGTQAAAPAVA